MEHSTGQRAESAAAHAHPHAPAHAPAKKKPRTPEQRAALNKALIKFAVGCVLTLIMGTLLTRYDILSGPAAIVGVGMQIMAMAVFLATSDIVEHYEIPHVHHHREALSPAQKAKRRHTGYRFVVSLFVVIAFVLSYTRYDVLAYPPPWKVTDPSRKLFNPASFRFTDYRKSADIDKAIQALFPPGTPKTTVDHVLHDTGHAAVKLYDEGRATKVFAYVYNASAARGFVTGLIAWVIGATEADKVWYVLVRYDSRTMRMINATATVVADQTGTTAYTQMTPTGSAQPYAPPAPALFK